MKHIPKFLSVLCAAALAAASVPYAALPAAAQTSGVTREAWIHELVTLFGMSVEDESTMEHPFTDTGSSTYAHDIDLAANYGVFDIEGETFDPDGYVTREFAAHTANYCIGYFDNGTQVSFTDAVYYEEDAAAAVQHGWFSLTAGAFEPDALMTPAQEETILNDLRASLSETVIDENAKDTVTYKSSVTQIGDSVDAAYFCGHVVIYGTAPALRTGQLFTVMLGGAQHLYKAGTVTRDADGNQLVKVSDADIADAVTGVQIQGYGDVDYSGTMFYATDVAADTGNLIRYKPGISGVNPVQTQTVNSVNITTDEHNAPCLTFSEEIDMDGASISVEGSVKNIKPSYELDYDGTNVNSFYLNVDADAELSCTMTGKLVNVSESHEVSLAKVPVYCGGPMSANIVLSLSVSVSGEVTMQYNWDCSGGVSYTKAGGWRVTKNFQKKGFTISASGSEKIAAKVKLNAELFGYEVGASYVMGGEKGTYKSTPRNGGAFFCEDLKVYAFAEFGADLNLFDLVTFSQSVEFIKEDNSPLRYHKHWEDGVEVPKCTFSDSDPEPASGRSGKRSGYTAYSMYGLEFDDVISPLNSTDTSRSTRYALWDEDRVLTENITVDGDLYIACNVDLNGKVLTVSGSVYQSEGVVEINNGIFNIGGSYYMQKTSINSVGETEYEPFGASLVMTHAHDRVNIVGSFITHQLSSYSSAFTQGILSVAGDVWSDGGLSTACDESFTFVLNGTGDQHVYMGDYSSRFCGGLEVTDPQRRTIVCSGLLYIHKLLSDIRVEAQDLTLCELDLNGHTMTIDGDVTVDSSGYGGFQDQAIDLNAGTLQVNGDLTHLAGSLDCNNGTLLVSGDFLMQDAYVNNVGETEYNICYARLIMEHPHDTVRIDGSFITHQLDHNACLGMTQGRMTICGDLWTDGMNNACSNDMTIILGGTGEQTLTLLGDNSRLSCLEVTDAQGRTIVCRGELFIHKLLSDVTISAQELTLRELDLNGHTLRIRGDVMADAGGYGGLQDQPIDLNAGALVIDGDLTHTAGTIDCNNGLLQVNGSYFAQNASVNNVGETEYSECTAGLLMKRTHDRVNITGDLITHAVVWDYFTLESGVLTVGGDLWSDGGLGFSDTGMHRTVLNGSKKQTVTLDASHSFDVLVLTQPYANYTFSPSPCWHSLITVEQGSGDVNGDGVMTVADVVLLQKWIAAVPNTHLPCWRAADMNRDQRLDVTDLCLLKQMLVNA
ncbi:MAG: dockerin type I repeat-containing protein [Oscillospiraceae bacterium]|nr:dockerin type I repeat-containing protein [Oscillospiraceae bacterium]